MKTRNKLNNEWWALWAFDAQMRLGSVLAIIDDGLVPRTEPFIGAFNARFPSRCIACGWETIVGDRLVRSTWSSMPQQAGLLAHDICTPISDRSEWLQNRDITPVFTETGLPQKCTCGKHVTTRHLMSTYNERPRFAYKCDACIQEITRKR